MVACLRWRVRAGARWVGNGVVTDQGIVLRPVGGYMYSSKCIGTLMVEYWHADQVWELDSMQEGNRTVGGQWVHHRHGNNIVVIILHVHGMRLHAHIV